MDSLDHTDWVRLLGARSGPRYLAIVDELAAALNRGELGSGTRLPPQRELAHVLAVDVTTVSRAMREAQRRGLVVARGRAGTFLTVPAKTTATVEGADLSVNYPPPLPAALQDVFRETAASVARRIDADVLLDYPRHGWTLRQRAAGAHWCAGVSLPVAAERITLAGGAQQALVGIASLVCEPGDIVVTGGLTYPGMITVARRAGLRVVGVELDTEGIIPEALEQTCRRLQPKLVYIVPTFENPTTATASASRRARLAEVIERAGAWLVEDDGHAALLEGAPAPISAHIPERSYYVSSMSKPVSPGLRTAYVVAPTARDAERLARSLNALGQFPAPIVVEITTEWITEGHTTTAVSAMRQSAAERWDIARAVLPQLRAGAAFTNHFGWLPLPTGWHAESFAERARAHGVRVSPSSAFAVAARFAKPGLRVCLGAAPTLQQLSQSLEVLSDVLREDPLLSRPIY